MDTLCIHLNDVIKFKLNEYSTDIYYHRYDEINSRLLRKGRELIKQKPLNLDSEGYVRMQFWEFMEIFGPYTRWDNKNFLEPNEIIKVEE